MDSKFTEQEQAIKEELLEVRKKLVRGETSIEKQLEEILEKSTAINFTNGMLYSYEYLGGVYRMKGDFLRAIDLYKKGLKLAQDTNDQKMIASMYNWLGSGYFFTAEYEKSFDYANKSVLLYDKLGLYEKKSDGLINLGTRHGEIGNYEKAEGYLNQAIEIGEKFDENSETWANYYALSTLYWKQGKLEQSREENKKAIALAEKHKSTAGIVYTKVHEGDYLLKKEMFSEAVEHYKTAYELSSNAGILSIAHMAKLKETECFIGLGLNQDAEQSITNLMSELVEKRHTMDAYRLLSEACENQNRFKDAYDFHSKEVALLSELNNIDSKKHMATTEAKYQNKLKESEKEVLRLQKLEMEQRALRAQLNPHFLMNCLNSINLFIQENESDMASKFLLSFGGLMRKTLELSEGSFLTIEEEILFLKDYLTLEQMRFPNSFEFDFVIGEELEEDFCLLPSMVFQPYLALAIKTLRLTDHPCRITISFEELEEDATRCTITIKQKQIEVEKFKEASSSMAIVPERLRSLEEQFNISFKLSTEVVQDNKQNVIGIKQIFIIPDLNNFQDA